jgi:hypothetical protein
MHRKWPQCSPPYPMIMQYRWIPSPFQRQRQFVFYANNCSPKHISYKIKITRILSPAILDYTLVFFGPAAATTMLQLPHVYQPVQRPNVNAVVYNSAKMINNTTMKGLNSITTNHIGIFEATSIRPLWLHRMLLLPSTFHSVDLKLLNKFLQPVNHLKNVEVVLRYGLGEQVFSLKAPKEYFGTTKVDLISNGQ